MNDYNDLYNKTITVDGIVYHYDPDQDIYYRRYAPMSTWDRYSPLIVLTILGIIALVVSYYK